MKIKKVELSNFKRFTHLIVENIPETTKLIVLVGPNGSGKTSFMEALNFYYKYWGYGHSGDYHYLIKKGKTDILDINNWYGQIPKVVNIEFHDIMVPMGFPYQPEIKGRFYFRSAYRNEPDFQINSMQKQQDPTQSIRLDSLIQNDQTVSTNYQRLIVNTVSDMFNPKNDNKTVATLRDELIGRIREALERVFDDLKFSSLGEPLNDGNFYFTKGDSENFSYRNLSAGEKSAFDLILDMVVQAKYYPDAIYCIDEPETHMHTMLQGKVLRELFLLIPGKSQLLLSTHSIGMLQEAEEIEKEYPGTVAFLDFGERDFDTKQVIFPTKIGKVVMYKFYELVFGDFAKLILPKTIVFCEGNPNGAKRKDFDKTIYSIIFENTHPEAFFISGGSCTEIENIEKMNGEIINTLLKNTKIIKIVDRDDRSSREVLELSKKGIKVLGERNIESYLFDDEVIKKLCNLAKKPEEYNECIREKKEALKESINRGNAKDDYKSARGSIYSALKRRLLLTECGNTADTFIRDTLSRLITPDMSVYKRLEKDIFGE